MEIKLNVGSVRVNVSIDNVIGLDDDYFIPRFRLEMTEDRIVEWAFLGTAFDCYMILEYDSVNDLQKNLETDLNAIGRVLKRNKKRLLPRSDENERKIMNVTCTIGGICDDWINRE